MNCFSRVFVLMFVWAAMLVSTQSRANHIMGADLTWKHLGGDTILFTAAVYRNCESINLANTPFQYFGECAGFSNVRSITGTMCCTKDVTPDFGYGCSRCGNSACGNPFGIQLILIQAKIVFPTGCCSWVVSWSQNSRDGAITTGAAGQTFYTECQINVCQKNPPDNSPFFNTPAVNITCLGTCTTLDNSATDIDRNPKGQGDSLIYSLVPPLQAHNVPITYTKGYTYFSPLTNDTNATSVCRGFSLNKKTGSLQFQGLKNEATVVAIQVEEYRPDTLGNFIRIGTVRRDMELINAVCPVGHLTNTGDQPPVVTGINGGSTYSLNICADQQTCFNIKAFDLDPPDTVSLSWDHGIPGATFTITPDGKKWPTGVFCWRPKMTDTSSFAHNFTVTAQDNRKPPGKSSKTFSVFVSAGPTAVYSAKITHCGNVQFSADVSTSSLTPVIDYQWTGDGAPGYGPLSFHGQNGLYIYNRPGIYHYSLTVTGPSKCTVTYNDSIDIRPFPFVSLKDTIVCANSPNIVLRAFPFYETPPCTYVWSTGDKTNPINVLITKDTSISVTMTDASGCKNTNFENVIFLTPPPPHPAVDVYTCGINGVPITATMSPNVVWTKIIGTTLTHNFSTQNPLLAMDPGLYIAMGQNSKICPGVDSFRVHIIPSGITYYADTDICAQDSVPFSPNILGAGPVWIDTGSGYKMPNRSIIISGMKNITSFKLKFLRYSNYTAIQCADTEIYTFHLHPKPTINLIPVPETCVHDNPFNLGKYVDSAQQTGGYWYYRRNYSAIVGSFLYPAKMGVTANDPSAGYIHYHYTDANRCTSDDSTRVIIWDNVSAGKSGPIWKECGRYILNNTDVYPRYGGTWATGANTPQNCIQYSGDTVFFNPDLVPGNGIYTFIYTYKSSPLGTGCSGTDTVQLNLVSKPLIMLSSVDTICSNTGNVPLIASPDGGVWQFADGTNPKAIIFDKSNNVYLFNPDSAGQGVHTLQYSFGYGKNYPLCRDVATMKVFVEKVPDLNFITSDSSWSYCTTHAPVMLIPNYPGGTFVGQGVYEKGNTWYFDPSKTTTKLVSVLYRIKEPVAMCDALAFHDINVVHPPDVKMVTDTFICGVNNVFTLTVSVKNGSQVSWASPYNGQDGGYFIKPINKDSFYSINYLPGPQQLKLGYFIVNVNAWADSLCDSVHKTFKMRIKPGPIPDFVSDIEGCDSFTTKFKELAYDSSGNIVKYEWVFGDSSSHSYVPNPTHTFHGDTTAKYTFYNISLSVTSNDGCENTITKPRWIIVDGKPFPIITAIPTFTTLDRATIHFDISPKSKNMDTTDSSTIYYWNFGDTANHNKGGISKIRNPVYTYTDTGKYTVVLKITNGNGCIGMDSAIALIDIRPAFAIFIPNAFLPGTKKGGGKYINSNFKPVISSYSSFEMEIYNRYGILVYAGTDPNTGWDGTVMGVIEPEDVYTYSIKVKDIWEKEYQYNGNVTLIR